MIALTSQTKRSLLTSGLFVLILLVFVVGAQRQARRMGVLGPAHAEIRARAAERSRQIETWEADQRAEHAVWQRIARRFAAALPVREPRLRASSHITSLAAACRLREVRLVEIREQIAPGLIANEDDWDVAGDDDGGDLWSDLGDSEAPAGLGCYEFELTFRADHRDLLDFLGRLGREDVLVEAQAIRVSRDGAELRVEMELAAYGRQG